jgi:hypothetical protein
MKGLAIEERLVKISLELLLRVQNPLTNVVPFRFANDTQDTDVSGWLTLGQVASFVAVRFYRVVGSQ